ncbi:hypothetical protein Hanom_Chr07g00674511 [Helianthus anomalus]
MNKSPMILYVISDNITRIYEMNLRAIIGFMIVTKVNGTGIVVWVSIWSFEEKKRILLAIVVVVWQR